MTTKLRLAITVSGRFVEGLLTGGNVHDVTVAETLLEDVVGCRVAPDTGHDSDNLRKTLRSNNNIPVIPGRKNQKIPVVYDRAIYSLRERIELLFGKIKENKRLVARLMS